MGLTSFHHHVKIKTQVPDTDRKYARAFTYIYHRDKQIKYV